MTDIHQSIGRIFQQAPHVSPLDQARGMLVTLNKDRDVLLRKIADQGEAIRVLQARLRDNGLSDVTCAHADDIGLFRLVRDSYGDVNVINGTQLVQYLQCRVCGYETGDFEEIERYRRNEG